MTRYAIKNKHNEVYFRNDWRYNSEFFQDIFPELWARCTHPQKLLGRMIGRCMTRCAIKKTSIMRYISRMTGDNK